MSTDIAWTGMYYPELLESLLAWTKVNVPELSDDDPNEPAIQILRAFALGMHYQASLLDFVAKETLLPSARLRESVKAHLALIGVAVKQETPAVVDLLVQMPSPLTADTVLAEGSQFATPETSTPAVIFETSADLALKASLLPEHVFTFRDSADPKFVDKTSAANTDGVTFQPWDATTLAGDMLYVGHTTALWDALVLKLTVAGEIWGLMDHAFEVYEGGHENAVAPTQVVYAVGVLTITVTSLLGSYKRAGALVRVRCLLTGTYEEVVSTWSGGLNKVVLTTHLDQTSPSEIASYYAISTLWREVAGTEYDDNGSRVVSYNLPESLSRRWRKATINDVEAYWLRLRIVSSAALVSPTIDRVRIDKGRQYIGVFKAVQGETFTEELGAVGTGDKSQRITTAQEHVIENSVVVKVDEGSGFAEWKRVSNFLSSDDSSRTFVVTYNENGAATVTFGDGVNGKLLALGAGVTLKYRIDATENGNVGAGTVVVNRSGKGISSTVTNPRPATGWSPAEGSTSELLETLKQSGPARLRTLSRALTVFDVETLAQAFVASDGSRPVARALCVKEGYGPKTVKVLCMSFAGAAVSSEHKTEIETYLNGDVITGKVGVLVLNSQATVAPFALKVVDVEVLVKGTASYAKIKAAIESFVNPLAKNSDGTYVYKPGSYFYRSALITAIFDADKSKTSNVILSLPGADFVLQPSELPVLGTVSINVVP